MEYGADPGAGLRGNIGARILGRILGDGMDIETDLVGKPRGMGWILGQILVESLVRVMRRILGVIWGGCFAYGS